MMMEMETTIQWAETNDITLLHDKKLLASFSSARWRRRNHPDLIFVIHQRSMITLPEYLTPTN